MASHPATIGETVKKRARTQSLGAIGGILLAGYLASCMPETQHNIGIKLCPNLNGSQSWGLSKNDSIYMDYEKNVVVLGGDVVDKVKVFHRPMLEFIERPFPLAAPTSSWWDSDRAPETESTPEGQFELQSVGAKWGNFAIVKGELNSNKKPTFVVHVTALFSQKRGLLMVLVDYQNQKDRGSTRYDRCEGVDAGFFRG